MRRKAELGEVRAFEEIHGALPDGNPRIPEEAVVDDVVVNDKDPAISRLEAQCAEMQRQMEDAMTAWRMSRSENLELQQQLARFRAADAAVHVGIAAGNTATAIRQDDLVEPVFLPIRPPRPQSPSSSDNQLLRAKHLQGINKITELSRDKNILDAVFVRFGDQCYEFGATLPERMALLPESVRRELTLKVETAAVNANRKRQPSNPFFGDVQAHLTWPHLVWAKKMRMLYRTNPYLAQKTDSVQIAFSNALDLVEWPSAEPDQFTRFMISLMEVLKEYGHDVHWYKYPTFQHRLTANLNIIENDADHAKQFKADNLKRQMVLRNILMTKLTAAVKHVDLPISRNMLEHMTNSGSEAPEIVPELLMEIYRLIQVGEDDIYERIEWTTPKQQSAPAKAKAAAAGRATESSTSASQVAALHEGNTPTCFGCGNYGHERGGCPYKLANHPQVNAGQGPFIQHLRTNFPAAPNYIRFLKKDKDIFGKP